MEKGHDMLNAVLPVTAAGEGAANDRIRHLAVRDGHLLLNRLPFLRLGLGDVLNLFLYGVRGFTQRRMVLFHSSMLAQAVASGRWA